MFSLSITNSILLIRVLSAPFSPFSPFSSIPPCHTTAVCDLLVRLTVRDKRLYWDEAQVLESVSHVFSKEKDEIIRQKSVQQRVEQLLGKKHRENAICQLRVAGYVFMCLC